MKLNNMWNGNIRQLRQPASRSSFAARRLRANWPAELKVGRQRISCMVLDISSEGAKLALAAAPHEHTRVLLIMGNIGPVAAEVVWQANGRAGLRFVKEQQWVIGLGTQRFDASAWTKTAMTSPLP